MVRQRDIFPMPLLPVPARAGAGCRAVARRARRRRRALDWANDGAQSINSLAGRDLAGDGAVGAVQQ
eukprot:7036633-Pyramimonas_sp.AAC.1